MPPGSPEEELAHHEAGHVLNKQRTGHGHAQGGAVGASLAERFQEWIDRAVHADLLDAAEENLLKHHWSSWAPATWTARSATSTTSRATGCSATPSASTTSSACDAGRPGPRLRPWALNSDAGRPHPTSAPPSLAATGRSPTDAERRLLESFGAIEVATALVKGHQENDAALSAHGEPSCPGSPD